MSAKELSLWFHQEHQDTLRKWFKSHPSIKLWGIEEQVGLPHTSLHHFISGRRNIPVKHIDGLLKALRPYGFRFRPPEPGDNKQFLLDCPLQLRFPADQQKHIDGILHKANESVVINFTMEQSTVGDRKFVEYTISIPTTNFAYGYYLIGLLIERHPAGILSKKA